MTQKPRIRRCHQTPLPFIQIRIQKSMFCTQSGIVGDDGIIYSSGQNVQLILAGLLTRAPRGGIDFGAWLGYLDWAEAHAHSKRRKSRDARDLAGLGVRRVQQRSDRTNHNSIVGAAVS
jgi:hypothetical protein